MGYTTVADRTDAVDAAAALATAGRAEADDDPGAFLARFPLLVDHVSAEAGVVEPRVCARALRQAHGDIVRAVSLVRAWAATLPRLGRCAVATADMRVERRITPAFGQPSGGQYLGASLDYAQRLLDLDERRHANTAPPAVAVTDAIAPNAFPAAIEPLVAEDLIEPGPAATPVDVTRTRKPGARGALLQLLARGETGTMTALAYTAIRGYGQRQDPTLVELRSGAFAVAMQRPDGTPFVVGEMYATIAEVTLYRLHDEGDADAHFTLGVGATPGRVERRAIAAAMLDAGCARAKADPGSARRPCEDDEFIVTALDGQEASGFVEHLKLPHYVTFTSDLDRVRAARSGGASS